MRILGLDTSSLAASCALWENGRLIGEFFTNAGLTHSQTVMPMVQELLRCTRTALQEVDGVAVSTGPGSFTGLRIGISAAKGLALGLDRPCAPVSTLEGLAANVELFPGLIAPVMDARCSQVYTALFESGKSGLHRLEPDSALSIEELGERLQGRKGPVLLVGDGARLCAERLGDAVDVRMAPQALLNQRASSVCSIAAAGGRWMPAQELTPSYLRLAQAQRELLKRQGELKETGI